MTAFITRMPAGIAGDVNRAQHHTVETQVITPSGTTGHPTAFGIPVILDSSSHQIRSVAKTDTGSIYGFLVRPYPAISSTDAVGTATPMTSGPCDVMRRGYMAVKLAGTATAVKGGTVYVYADVSTDSHVQGGLEAESPATGFALAGATFMGPADANGLTEISFNIA